MKQGSGEHLDYMLQPLWYVEWMHDYFCLLDFFFLKTIYLNTQRDELWNYFSESRLTCMLGLVEASWLFHYLLLCFLDGFHIAYQSIFLVASHSGTGFNSSTCKIKMIDDVHVYASFCKIFIDILTVSTVSKKDTIL